MDKVDERYKRGMIYTIRNYTDDTLIYVGSTINTLSKRFYKHKDECKNYINHIKLHSLIENNDWTDWYIELYEHYPCNNKKELDRREGQVIREIGTINKNIAGRTKKERYNENADKLKEYQKEYYENNANKINEKRKEKVCCSICGILSRKGDLAKHQKTKKCMSKIPDKINESKKKYRENNKEKISQHKTEKICCDICCALISRHNISKHQRTKTCLAIKNLSNTDIPSDSHIVDL